MNSDRSRDKPQPREHDYRRGHAIEMMKRVGNTEEYTACGFGVGVKAGDTLLLKMSSGKDARWRFKKVEYFSDPTDMFKMVIEPIEYLEPA